MIVLYPHPAAVLDAVPLGRLRVDQHLRLRMQLPHSGQLAMLRMEELERAAAAREHERILFHELGRRYRALGRLGVERRRGQAPVFEQGRSQLQTSRRRAVPHRTVLAEHAFGRLTVRGIERVIGVAQHTRIADKLLPRGLEQRLARILRPALARRLGRGRERSGAVVQVPVHEIDVVLPAAEDLRIQATAQFDDDLLVRFRLVVGGDLHHGARRRPPGTGRVALCAHGHRQHEVGKRHRGRGHIRIGIHDERDLLHGMHDARRILTRAGQRVGRLDPHHLYGIRETVLDGLQQTIRTGVGYEIAALNGQGEVVVELLGTPLGRREILTRGISCVAFERVVHEDVAARDIDVSAHGHEVAAGQAQCHGGKLLVEGQTPLDSPWFCRGVEPCRATDGLGVEITYLRRPLRGHVCHSLRKLFEARAPQVHALVVIEILGDDDVEPRAGQRGVCAGPDLQPILRPNTPPGEARVD